MGTDLNKPSERFNPDRSEIAAWRKNLNDIMTRDDLESVMKSLASIIDEQDLQCLIHRRALDWLQTLKAKLDDAERRLDAVRVIEYQACMGNSDGEPVAGTERLMYLVYNRNVISDADAEHVLNKGDPDLDPRVVVLWPSQAIAMFPNLFTKEMLDALQSKGGQNG